MKAIGFKEHLPINEKNSLFEFETPMPKATDHDLLVKVAGTSVNPVDVGVRGFGRGTLETPKVIGWDAIGEVVETGSEVSLFNKGDRVFYAGSFKRSGSDSEYQLVDERIVGHAPKSLTDSQIAGMPLTSLTAWEALFEKLHINIENVKDNQHQTILIINGAGGVGSVATQLAKLAGLKVISTASRDETIKWTKAHGADMVVNHRKDLVSQVRHLGYQYVDYILELNNLDQHWNEMTELIKPNGQIASITENKRPIDLKKLTKKRGTFAWEWMYSKSYYETPDEITQHQILDKVAEMLDSGKLKSTVTQVLLPINVNNLKKAHSMVEEGHMMGKVVVVNSEQ